MFQNEWIAAACNRSPNVAKWQKERITFGSANMVVWMEFSSTKGLIIRQTLSGHRGTVTAVEWLSNGSIVSASADGTLRLWNCREEKYETDQILVGDESAIHAMAVHEAEGREMIAAATTSGLVLIWSRSKANQKDFECVQRWTPSASVFPMALALAQLPGASTNVLVTGSTDCKLTVYCSHEGQFVQTMRLSGHTDWIRSLSFLKIAQDIHFSNGSNYKAGELILASASQDKYIRLWRFSACTAVAETASRSILDQLPKEMWNSLQEAEPGMSKQLSTRMHIFCLNGTSYSILLDSVLMGHEDWVYSLSWHPVLEKEALDQDGNPSVGWEQPLKLLSSSSDKSIIMWEADAESGTWMSKLQVGEVGGNALGVYGALWSPTGSHILGHGFHGAFQLWAQRFVDGEEQWTAEVGLSAHYGPVRGLSWDPTYTYLISVSDDQTCRIFAPWNRDDMTTWHEIARPQIHGYDLQCISFIHPLKYACGAEGEKVVRIFQAPKTFLESLQNITGSPLNIRNMESVEMLGAAQPALGLSNKPMDSSVVENAGPFNPSSRTTQYVNNTTQHTLQNISKVLTKPPFEEQLLQYTLWPEIEKLYGHGYEVFSVAGELKTGVFASASTCRAGGRLEDAAIRVWESESTNPSIKAWTEIQSPLISHSLTTTDLQFSHQGDFLVSVSRDRMWSLFRKVGETFQLISNFRKAHARIIWGVSWSFDDRLFATASRDKTVKIWKNLQRSQNKITEPSVSSEVEQVLAATIEVNISATCIAFCPIPTEHGYIFAVGLENGDVLIYVSERESSWSLHSRHACHDGTVVKVAWRCCVPAHDTLLTEFSDRISIADDFKFQLATCGEDHSVRLFTITI